MKFSCIIFTTLNQTNIMSISIMEKTLPLEERSIYQIYLESQETITYMIPVYQRNYAWEDDEITALIKDVYDSFHKNEKAPYYIGTLVTYKRGDSEYEVIDGQQRLTTIYIILKALGINSIRNKLTYSARKISASTIKKLDDYPNLGDEVDAGIRNGYKFAEKALNAIVSQEERQAFQKFFLEEVHIIHYSVPKDVDLNHYFEVMNSRGEQLEKHEIVKSTLSQYLKNKVELATFSHVWEACSEMNIYIQQTFPTPSVFGYNLYEFKIDSFENIPEQDASDGKETIMNLLKHPISKIEEVNELEQNDKFQPIIDFPNFLLIVLKITRIECEDNFNPLDFTLDDKELLNEFKKALNCVPNKEEFAKKFIFNLLKAKYLLDNFIVHHAVDDKELTGDNPWKLQYYYHESAKKQYPRNLSAESDIQKELVHLLSMFEVSFTPKQRKNYLFYCLLYLFENHNQSDSSYREFLRCLADKYFYDVYLNADCLSERNQPKPNAFDIAMLKGGKLNVEKSGGSRIGYKEKFGEIYKQGKADVPLFVFNYTDYILWRKYAEELRGNTLKNGSKERRSNFFNELGCSDFELEPFTFFYFSRTRKSLEHYYPQAKAGEGKPLSSEDINCFGNFAMIGAEANSSGSNWDPKTKLDHYSDGKSNQVSIASLKFKIMMQMCQDNYKAMLTGNLERNVGMEWNAEDMQAHQKKMLDLIIVDG